MTDRYAVVSDGVVVNVVLWDGTSPCDKLVDAILLPTDAPVGVGHLFVEGEFQAPPPAPNAWESMQ